MSGAVPATNGSHQVKTGMAKMKQILLSMTRLVTFPSFQQSWPSWPPGSLSLRRAAPRPAALQASTRERVLRGREARRDADARVISGV